MLLRRSSSSLAFEALLVSLLTHAIGTRVVEVVCAGYLERCEEKRCCQGFCVDTQRGRMCMSNMTHVQQTVMEGLGLKEGGTGLGIPNISVPQLRDLIDTKVPQVANRDLIDTKVPKKAKSMLSRFEEAGRKLQNMGMDRGLKGYYREVIEDNEDVLDRAQAFAYDANHLGIPVGFSAQPAFGFFWELVNMVASKFSGKQGVDDLSRATALSQAFPEGTLQLLQAHGFNNFTEAILMRTRAELKSENVLSFEDVPEYVDWLNIDDNTGRHMEPANGNIAYPYNQAWISASANMMQVAKMESALYFMNRAESGGGSPIFYQAMRGSDGMETAVRLGMYFAEFIVGPNGDYPVPQETYQALSRRLAELWIKLASDAEAKVLHVILIAPQSAESNAYLSQAFAWLSRKMVHPSLHSQLQNRMRLVREHLVNNEEFVAILKQLNENADGKWSFMDDLQLRIRPYTCSGPGDSQELPGSAPFAFYQRSEDKAMFDDWSRQIKEIFEEANAASQ